VRRLRHDVEDGAVEAPQHRHVHRSLLFCIDLHPYLCLCTWVCVRGCAFVRMNVYLVGFGGLGVGGACARGSRGEWSSTRCRRRIGLLPSAGSRETGRSMIVG